MKHTKISKAVVGLLATTMLVPALTACNSTEKAEDGKVTIQVGSWPLETDSGYQAKEEMRLAFMEKYPDIIIEPNTYGYTVDTFTARATAKNVPTMLSTWFTEVDKLVDAGYAADITDAMEEYGYLSAMNPDLLEAVTKDGKVYGIPYSAYAQGLYINKKLFKEAGLVNEDGSIKVPDTYTELAEYAQIIKEKTGVDGYTIPNAGNCGGWHLMNIAWSNGVEFVEQQSDGTWKATFDTPEMQKTLEWLYDLKWNKNALNSTSGINQGEIVKLFGTEQTAMMFYDPPCSTLKQKYEMNTDDIMVTRMPAGDAGRYTQMGGDYWFISSEATPEQIDACFKWLAFTGVSPEVDEEQVTNLETSFKTDAEKNAIITDQVPFELWVSGNRNEKINELRQKYTNVKREDYEQYYSFEDVTIKSEVPVACQQLYSVLDKAVQEIEANKNVDIPALITELATDYQTNHLNNLD